MIKKVVLAVTLVLFWVGLFEAHDLYLKLHSFFLKPNTPVSIALFNGTFEKSENSISRNRMLDVSVVAPGSGRSNPDTSHWRDDGSRTILDFKTGEPGTYVVGVSTASRMIRLAAKDFNGYLKHDGVLDILDQRTKNNELEKDARERYSKHVKAVIQVGEKRTNGFSTKLGYPVELIPLQNPYKLKKGDTLEVLFLRDGKPVSAQLIYANYEAVHKHEEKGEHHESEDHHEEEGEHREEIQIRTDKSGVARFKLGDSGRWYIRVIHMVNVADEEIDYESKWATLTFEVN